MKSMLFALLLIFCHNNSARASLLGGLSTLSMPAMPFQKQAQPPSVSYIILPGFGNDQIDYINPLQRGEEQGALSLLRKRGIDTSVVPIQRREWLNIARGVFTREFWSNECRAETLFKFYCDSVVETVEVTSKRNGGNPIVLVGHSAGGWLARSILGDDGYTHTLPLLHTYHIFILYYM